MKSRRGGASQSSIGWSRCTGVNNIPSIGLQVANVSRDLKEDGTLEEPNRETPIGFDASGPNRWLTQARTEPVVRAGW